MTDNLDFELEVREVEPPKPIPEGLYKAFLKEITEGTGGFGPYFKFVFEINEGEFKTIERTLVASKKITKAKNGKHSKLFNIIRGMTKQEPTPGVTFKVGKLLNQPCQILVKNDKVVDGVQWQSVTEVMAA